MDADTQKPVSEDEAYVSFQKMLKANGRAHSTPVAELPAQPKQSALRAALANGTSEPRG